MTLRRRTLQVYVDDAAEPSDRTAVRWDATNNRWVAGPGPVTTRRTLAAGTITVNDTATAAATDISVARQVDGGTVGASYSITRVVGTSYTITAKDGVGVTQAADTSTLAVTVTQP